MISMLARHPEILAEERRNLLETLMWVGVRASNQAAPNDRDGLRQSLFPGAADTFTVLENTRATIGSKLIYAGAQEDASEYTSRKKWWPPSQPIEDWVRRNAGKLGVTDESDVERVAFFVRAKIAFQGIEPKRFMQKGYQAVLDKLSSALELTANRLMERLGLK